MGASVAVSPRRAFALLTDRGTRTVLAAAVLLGLATIGDGFVYLVLQRRTELALGWFPLLAVGTSLAYLLLAAPLGILADRIGRLPMVLGGYGALIAVYLALLGPADGWSVSDRGRRRSLRAFYAATDGVLMALAAPLLPEHVRTTGLALVQTGQAVAVLCSSVLRLMATITFRTDDEVASCGPTPPDEQPVLVANDVRA